jgi:hypothetical protein
LEGIRKHLNNTESLFLLTFAPPTTVCTSNAYVSIVENIITLEKEDNLD